MSGSIGSGELGKLLSGAGVEQVGRAGNGACILVAKCPDKGNVGIDRHGRAELVFLRRVGSDQLRALVFHESCAGFPHEEEVTEQECHRCSNRHLRKDPRNKPL